MNTMLAVAASVVLAGCGIAAAGPRSSPGSGGQTPSAALCADTAAVVERAVGFVARFGQELGGVIATERYEQEIIGAEGPPPYTPPPITITGGISVQATTPMSSRTSTKQTLRSSFLFVPFQGGEGWVGYRDVIEVNGKAIHPIIRNLTKLEVVGESALERWRRLSEESARYNIGSVTRTLNVPTFALLVLFPGNQTRFAFTEAGEHRDDGITVCDVTFQETTSPTIIRTGTGDDVPSSGSLRIEAASGRILRTELMAGSPTTGVAAKTTVQYGFDAKLRSWVPREMHEDYQTRDSEHLLCVARYSDYQRVEVTAKILPQF